ncbi:MAG: hypothetical protein WC348_03060 [Patescibacteria group bacterium]|jgi:hypothetical protein
MQKSGVLGWPEGSAEQVVAHAAWQRSRGHNPSMSFVGERNPCKALALANSVIRAAQHTKLIGLVGAAVVQCKSYPDMTDAEIEVAARHIIASSSSEDEARQRLRDELGYPYDDVALCTTTPDDATGREARELVRGLGGLVMKNGAMAMVMMYGHDGVITL